jgi:lipoprotein-releasing system permease protein
VVLLSAFNGMEQLIDQIYSEFDPSIVVRSSKGKAFYERDVNWDALKTIQGTSYMSKGVEALAVLEYNRPISSEKTYRVKRTNAKLFAVDSSFLKVIAIKSNFKGPNPSLGSTSYPEGIIGISLLQKLEAPLDGSFKLFLPKKNISVRAKQPFYIKNLNLSSVLFYRNKEVNDETLLWPIEAYRKLVGDTMGRLTNIYFSTLPNTDLLKLKNEVSKVLGKDFEVKTYKEKNELIFKTSKSEKAILTLILIFVFVLASFNLVSSLTMLFIEKKDNFLAFKSMGLTKNTLFNVFFFQGLLICFFGVFVGVAAGYVICFTQLSFGFLHIAPGQPYPIGFSFTDFLTIIGSVSILSILFSYATVKLLLMRSDDI